MAGIKRYFTPLNINGQTYKFLHLNPTAVDLPKDGLNGDNLRVRVSYSSHVFSTSQKPTAAFAKVKDEQNNDRYFCLRRYKLSEKIPAMCMKLLEQNEQTWISKDNNQASNLAVIDSNHTDGDHDVIFYSLFPSKVDGLDVEMVVKSAFNKYINFSKIKRKYGVKQQVKTCFFKNKSVP